MLYIEKEGLPNDINSIMLFGASVNLQGTKLPGKVSS